MSNNKTSRKKALHTLNTRIKILCGIGVVMALILIGRLFYLQIIQGDEHYNDYVEITKKELSIDAPRGNILDCNGNILAGNELTYSVTIKDTTDYNMKTGEFNEMLLRLVHLLERYNQSITTPIPIILNEHDEYQFNGTDDTIHRFIRDAYGKEKIEKRKEKGEDAYADSAEDVMKALKILYNFTSKWPNAESISKKDTLSICNIRYAMVSTSFTKYRSTVICPNISDEVKAAVLEEQSNLKGVEIKEELNRVYPEGIYFSHILGYTGKASEEDLDSLQAEDVSYVLGDTVGRDGIEKTYERQLKGTKGSETVYLNNVGLIMDTVNKVEPSNGNDIQLTLDKDLQIAVYNIIERRLASVIVGKLYNGEFTPTVTTSASDFKIPIKTVYFQMINNNILSLQDMTAEDASDIEKEIYSKFSPRLEQVLTEISNQLTTKPQAMTNLSEEMQQYFTYIYQFLQDDSRKLLSGIDTSDEAYINWKEGNLSLSDFLHAALTNNWIDSSKLDAEEKYSDVDQLYDQLVTYIMDRLPTDTGFAKVIYKYLIQNEIITGNEICLALFAQGVLKEDAQSIENLKAAQASNDKETAFRFMEEKLSKVEITPAQLALDPCSGSATVVDKNTGNILAMVSYPGYDINRFSGTIDAQYYKQLNDDLSQPFYNRATQTRTSPGSTFKMITATADLEEGILALDDQINCTGIYERPGFGNPKCWIAREKPLGQTHGLLNVVGGLKHSCNIFFYESGYRLSLDENQKYNANLGLEKLKKYAESYGFGSLTGIEIKENISQISDEFPVPSAIGQGTNNFTAISIARYATAVATNGNLYQFRLMNQITDTDGNVIESGGSTMLRHLEFADTTWNALHQGMYGVTHQGGSAGAIFEGFPIDIAGKSGTAEENKLRGSHALFVSFGPYENPEIITTVTLPNAYNSSNAALVTKKIYEYYKGITNLEEIRKDINLKDEDNIGLGD